LPSVNSSIPRPVNPEIWRNNSFQWIHPLSPQPEHFAGISFKSYWEIFNKRETGYVGLCKHSKVSWSNFMASGKIVWTHIKKFSRLLTGGTLLQERPHRYCLAQSSPLCRPRFEPRTCLAAGRRANNLATSLSPHPWLSNANPIF
jgi:hypothetical protein